LALDIGFITGLLYYYLAYLIYLFFSFCKKLRGEMAYFPSPALPASMLGQTPACVKTCNSQDTMSATWRKERSTVETNEIMKTATHRSESWCWRQLYAADNVQQDSACSFSVRQDSDISTQGTAPVYVIDMSRHEFMSSTREDVIRRRHVLLRCADSMKQDCVFCLMSWCLSWRSWCAAALWRTGNHHRCHIRWWCPPGLLFELLKLEHWEDIIKCSWPIHLSDSITQKILKGFP
jgi:hypothetical protein